MGQSGASSHSGKSQKVAPGSLPIIHAAILSSFELLPEARPLDSVECRHSSSLHWGQMDLKSHRVDSPQKLAIQT